MTIFHLVSLNTCLKKYKCYVIHFFTADVKLSWLNWEIGKNNYVLTETMCYLYGLSITFVKVYAYKQELNIRSVLSGCPCYMVAG